MKPSKLIYLVFFLLILTDLNGQLKITDANTQPYTPENLIRNVFLGSGVEVTSINYKGDSRSVGYFSSGLGEINLERGIVISTGQVSSTTKENETLNDSGDQMSNSNDQDPDLFPLHPQ